MVVSLRDEARRMYARVRERCGASPLPHQTRCRTTRSGLQNESSSRRDLVGGSMHDLVASASMNIDDVTLDETVQQPCMASTCYSGHATPSLVAAYPV